MAKTSYNLKTCMLTKIKWCDRKTFMQNKNTYSAWKIPANGKHICSLKKYMHFESIFYVSKYIYSNWKIIVAIEWFYMLFEKY